MPEPIKRPGTPYYVIRFTVGDRRVERSTGETSKAKARAKAPAIIAEAIAEHNERSEPAGPLTWQDISFTKAMGTYIDSGRPKRFLSRLLDHFDGMKLGEIDNAVMVEAACALYPNAQPATIRRQLYVPVNAIINLAKDDKLRAPSGGNQRTAYFTPAQVDTILQLMSTTRRKHLAPLIVFLVGQGTRVGETLLLDGVDVDLEAKSALLRSETTKNGKERRMVLQPRVVAALSLLDTVGRPGPVFRKRGGMPFPKSEIRGGQIRNPFENVMEEMGLDPREYTPHVLRHTWATWHYAVHKDPLKLKHEGGWRSGEHERYVKLAPEGMRESILAHGWFPGERQGNAFPQDSPANKDSFTSRSAN